MKFSKRMLSWLLTFTMVCSFSGITAFAEGSSTENEAVEAVVESNLEDTEEVAAPAETGT